MVGEVDAMWCKGLSLEEWEEQATDAEEYYLHGKCHLWVLNNLKEGDIAVIWNTFDEDLGEVVLIHCYIKRGNCYLDVRGKTTDEDKMEEGFEDFYTYDVGNVECKSKKEYMSWLDKILGESWRKEIL